MTRKGRKNIKNIEVIQKGEKNMNPVVMIVVVVVVIQMMIPLMIGTNIAGKKVTEERKESEVEVTNIVKENPKEKKYHHPPTQRTHTPLMALENSVVKKGLIESKNERNGIPGTKMTNAVVQEIIIMTKSASFSFFTDDKCLYLS